MQAELSASVGHSDLVSILQQCKRTRDVHQAERVYAYMRRHHLQSHPVLGNYLVPMLVEYGNLTCAFDIFRGLRFRREASWTSLIIGLLNNGQPQHAILLYHEMRQENLAQPTKYTYALLLGACTRLQDVQNGHRLHDEIINKGLEMELYMASTLVDMYSKCCCLAEAQQVFNQLPIRNVVAWNALITGYAEHGLDVEVLDCFSRMRLEGVPVDAVTYVICLRACIGLGALETGLDIHNEITIRGLERDLFSDSAALGNTLVDMYSKCDYLAEARQVFDSLPVRNAISYTALIAGYAKHGLNEEVLSCLKQMELQGVSANAVTFVCSLQACGSSAALETGQNLHSEATKRGLDAELYVGSILVDMYAKCCSFAEARRVLHMLTDRNEVSWTALMAAYAERGYDEEVLNCFKQMQLESMPTSSVTLILCLKACGNLGALERGREVHAEIRKSGLEKDPFVGNMLIDMYGKCGSVVEGREVFDRLHVQDVVSWTTMIKTYCENHEADMAVHCFEEMGEQGVLANAVTFLFCMKSCGTIGLLERGHEVHGKVIQRGLDGDPFIGNALVDMYCKCWSLAEAQEEFDRLPAKSEISWTTLITGYSEHGFGEEALNCLKQMMLEGTPATAVTFVLCLKACSSIGALEVGREIHAEIRKSGLENDPAVGNSLIDMYGKCGSVVEGREVFDKLLVRNVVSWTAMIKTYGENHEGNMAIQCFKDMQEQGVKPDSVTFSCVLAACSHACLVLEGQELFRVMREEYKIEPLIDHYACMVDIFSRSGDIYEAERFLKAMQCMPSREIIMALLTACKMYGEVKVGERCFQHLMKLNEEDAAAYFLMASLYASAGRWADFTGLEKIRRLSGRRKKPGSALIEVNRMSHEFVVGTKQSKEVLEFLEVSNLHLKNEGLVPNLNLSLGNVIDEEEEMRFYKFNRSHCIQQANRNNFSLFSTG